MNQSKMETIDCYLVVKDTWDSQIMQTKPTKYLNLTRKYLRFYLSALIFLSSKSSLQFSMFYILQEKYNVVELTALKF